MIEKESKPRVKKYRIPRGWLCLNDGSIKVVKDTLIVVEPRSYRPSDRAICLALYGAGEHASIGQSLDSEPELYTVLEHEGAIVGCGACSIGEQGEAALRNGVIRTEFRRMGLGRFLLHYRLRQISKSGCPVTLVRVAAPPESAGFYLRQGFKLAREDVRTIHLVMKLTVCP